MNFNGVVIGLASFLIIGIFHPIVIKGEFYFGVRIWRAFLLAGIVTLAASLLRSWIISNTPKPKAAA